ncbi:MAG: alpha-hydroxy acid oxidase [Acidobacteria bacterium]|nr:alpha-hydroxy acid oxidase [Acidobacteriota bacterium]
MTQRSRQFPNPRDLAPLLRFKRFEPRPTRRRLQRAHTIEDLRAIAQRRTPRGPFDYTDGGADSETTLARARQAFADIEWRPRVLRNVAEVNLSANVLGSQVRLPFGIAPTGFTRLMHHEGEFAGAQAAAAAGIPFCLSTMGTRSIEEVAGAAPDGDNWFQLYMWKDRERSMALVERAKAAGFRVLVLTVDVPIAGDRLRDRHNGLTIPPTLTPRTIMNAISRPAWWMNLLTTEPLRFASLDSWNGTVAELLEAMFDPTVDFDDLRWIIGQWGGPVVVKGIQTVEDAVRCVEAGAAAIQLSNHGGRQLDRAPVPFYLLPAVVREVGDDVEIYLDTGIMHGADIVASLAAGARFAFVGRAYLYGLMAGGRRGVDRTIAILADQVARTMRLLGVGSTAELGPKHLAHLADDRRA